MTKLVIVLTVMALLCIEEEGYAQNLHFPDRWDMTFENVLPLYRQDTVTIRFIGDVMMHSKQIEAAHRKDGSYDFSDWFRHISDRLTSADISVANMEFALGGEPYSGYPAFSAPDAIAGQVAEDGIDIFLAANNHIYDRGLAGAERTLEQYRKTAETFGTVYTGLASDSVEEENTWPVIMNVKGIRIAFINFTYGTNGGRREGWPKVCYMNDRKAIAKAIGRAREKSADILIALPHWGNEYELTHSQEQEEVSGWLAAEGVDMIIGTHPHVVQDTASVEGNSHYGRTQIAYSLGNAVSNMSAANTQLELMVTARTVRHFNGDIEILPNELTFLWCSRPGGYNDSYTVLPVVENINRKETWQNPYDHENMLRTYRRVLEKTGIEENRQDINE